MNKRQLRRIIREETKKQLNEMGGVSTKYTDHARAIGRSLLNMVREMEKNGDAGKIGEELAFIISRELPPEYRHDFKKNF